MTLRHRLAEVKRLPLTLAEGALGLFEVAVGLGLVSFTAVALALGQFLLAAVLTLVLFGVGLRFVRRRSRHRRQRAGPT